MVKKLPWTKLKWNKTIGIFLMVLSLIGSSYVFVASWWMREQQIEANRIQFQAQMELNYALNSLLNDTEFGYAVIGEDYRVIEWNLALEKITGWTKAEIIAAGKGIEAVMYPEQVAPHKAAFVAAFAKEKQRRKIEAKKGEESTTPTMAILNCEIPPHGDRTEPLQLKITTRIVGEEKFYAIAHVDFPETTNIRTTTVKPENNHSNTVKGSPNDKRRKLTKVN